MNSDSDVLHPSARCHWLFDLECLQTGPVQLLARFTYLDGPGIDCSARRHWSVLYGAEATVGKEVDDSGQVRPCQPVMPCCWSNCSIEPSLARPSRGASAPPHQMAAGILRFTHSVPGLYEELVPPGTFQKYFFLTFLWTLLKLGALLSSVVFTSSCRAINWTSTGPFGYHNTSRPPPRRQCNPSSLLPCQPPPPPRWSRLPRSVFWASTSFTAMVTAPPRLGLL